MNFGPPSRKRTSTSSRLEEEGFVLLPRTPKTTTTLDDGGSGLWPESMSAASSWFGVVVFSFGVVPFVLNFR